MSEGMLLINVHTSEIYTPFSEYVDVLIAKGYANETIEQYAGHVSRFVDFIYELKLISIDDEVHIDSVKILPLYQEFLTLGVDSSNPLIQKIANNIGKKNKTSFRSISGGIEASLSIFIELKLLDTTDTSFREAISSRRVISNFTINKMVHNSWLEATTRRFGSKRNRQVIKLFPKSARRNAKSSLNNGTKEAIDKAFPITKCVDFFSARAITSTSNFSDVRNYLLYSLLASSGVRQSEALQVTVDDIDWENREIKIISPFVRSQIGLTEEEADRLVFKGRATSETFLIQPFAHVFWTLLKIYMQIHYKSNVSHRYLFQKHNGRPLFTADKSQRSKTFKAYLLNFKPKLTHLTLHSFRHMYGFYTLNYFPIVDKEGNATDKQGLPLAYVKILMGHQNISSTAVYARQDLDLIDFMIAASNGFIRDNNISMQDMAKQFYERQVKVLKTALLKESELNHDF